MPHEFLREVPIQPVKGAAKYFASYDTERYRPSVWMKVAADEDCKEDMFYFLSYHRTIEAARKKANWWQTKENKSVLKEAKTH